MTPSQEQPWSPLLTAELDQVDRPAVTIAGATMTRGDLFGAASVVAQRVRGADAAAVDATPSVETIVATLGCLLAGVPVVPVPPDSGVVERRHILNDSGATIWLGDRPEDSSVEHVPVDATERVDPSSEVIPSDATALVMYTSGTTGPPKGARISHRAIAACLDGLADAWDWTVDDVLVHGLPLFHVHGLVLGVLGALRVGSPLVHTGKPTPEGYARAVERDAGSLLFGVPTVWSRIASDPTCARTLGAARLLVSGSAPLPIPVREALAARSGQVPVERYGMTETLITLAQRHDRPRRPGSVGVPLPGVDARIVGEDGTVVPADGTTSGDLQVRGSTLFDGYGNRPATLDADGWFSTGDVATVDETGEYRIVGRAATDLIKSGGYRIGAGEIEDSLLGFGTVREVAVVGIADDDLGQRIVAFVVTEDGLPGDPDALIDHVAKELSRHKRPREIRFVDSLPRNSLGKVQKRLLVPGSR